MISLHTFTPPPSQCGYLPDRRQQLRYEIVATLTAAEYERLLMAGWRRFGRALFRPACPDCRLCTSLRVPVATFQPDRSQRRAAKLNDGAVTLTIGRPEVTAEKLALHDLFHAFQAEHVGWEEHEPKSEESYESSFVDNPFPTEEWLYRLDGELVGVGYIDRLPHGLSAIYFFHHPDYRDRSLGTWNVLSVIRRAGELRLPHAYLGYYVAGCRSLEYKSRFRPNEALVAGKTWVPFRGG